MKYLDANNRQQFYYLEWQRLHGSRIYSTIDKAVCDTSIENRTIALGGKLVKNKVLLSNLITIS